MPETLEQAQKRRQALRYGSASASTTNLLATGASSFPADETLHASDLDVDHLVLDGMKRRVGTKKWGKRRIPIYDDINVNVEWSLLDAVVERTIEGASTLTLTIHDPLWVLIGSGLFDTDENLRLDPVDVKLDRLWFRLVQVSPQGSTLTLIFEDRNVWYLRQYDKPRSVSRKSKTRAQFVEMMVREVKQVRIKFFGPEKNKRQRIEKIKREVKVEVSGSGKSLSHAKSLKVKGKRIDAGQRKNIEVAMRGADIEKAGTRPRLAMLVAGIAEGQMRTSAKNTRSGAAGPWQLLPSTERTVGFTHNAIQKTARYFLTTGFTGAGGAISLSRKHPDWGPGELANAIEGGGVGAAFYDKWLDEAKAILEAWGDDPNADVTVSSTRIKQYRFKRGEKGAREDSWTAAQRLASEVAWRCFSRGGSVWFVSESWLLKQRVLATITRTSQGVDTGSFGFTWDSGKTVQEVTFNISANRWSFPPGSVVQLKECGPANGRWIVHKISKSLFKSDTTITLSKAVKPKPEPAAETTTSETKVSGGGSLRVGDSPKEVIDSTVLPIARKQGINVTAKSVEAANARHGPTVNGTRSDHQGPPAEAWAADMSNGSAPTPQMDALAKALARTFDIPWSGAGARSKEAHGYRFQLIYRSNVGGNHFNHVHFGVKKIGDTGTPRRMRTELLQS